VIPHDPFMTVLTEDRSVGLKGFVVIHTLGQDGAGGGIRCAPDITLDEVKSLARAMTYKYSYFGLPFGGGKGGLVLDGATPPERRAEITLDSRGRNRGLTFEPEMLHCCGRRYRVLTPVRRIIAETTGKMVELSNTVILEGVTCQGIRAKNCPRAHYFYWREAWLQRP